MVLTSPNNTKQTLKSMIISPPPVIPTPTFNPPTRSFADRHVPTNVLMALLGREDPECTNISQFRTTTNIVLSSLTTIFACTWIALHLDTPSTNKSAWRSFRRRLGWMIVALIAPEAIAGIAMRDLVEAKELKDMWNTNFVRLCSPEIATPPDKTTEQLKRLKLKVKKSDTTWTLAHGFLAEMDGIRLYKDSDDDGDGEIFRPNRRNFEDPKIRSVIQQIGRISKDDIADKSKGDGITKFFVILQTTWFIIQCLARWAARLPVTELEVVTLAYAVLNILIYALWWHKPQSLSVPFRVFVEEDSEQVPEWVEVVKEDKEVSSAGVDEEEQMLILRHSSSSSLVDEESNALSTSETRSRRGTKLSQPPDELDWVKPPHSRVLRFFNSLYTDHGSWALPTLSGAIFGALHLIPLCLSVFPSGVERKLWQVSAFFVTVGPLGLLIIILTVTPFISKSIGGAAIDDMLGLGFSLPYAVARIILLVLTFTTLRMLPKEAFQNVEWTRFIPHF